MKYMIQSYSFAAFIAEVEGKRSNVEDRKRRTKSSVSCDTISSSLPKGKERNLPMQAHYGRHHVQGQIDVLPQRDNHVVLNRRFPDDI
jgi:hypothetical protein